VLGKVLPVLWSSIPSKYKWSLVAWGAAMAAVADPALLGLLLLWPGHRSAASTIANTQQEATLTVFMTLLPGIFLSGFLFPLEACHCTGPGFIYRPAGIPIILRPAGARDLTDPA
jgi:hypothetical protein